MGPEDYTDNYDHDDWGETDEAAAAAEEDCYPLGEDYAEPEEGEYY